MPGTPEERAPVSESPAITCPVLSRYIASIAAAGAVSRKSSVRTVPETPSLTTANPPPPILPAEGYTTASPKPTATAASTALPPRRKTSTPISAASGASQATAPCSKYVATSRSEQAVACQRRSPHNTIMLTGFRNCFMPGRILLVRLLSYASPRDRSDRPDTKPPSPSLRADLWRWS